MMPALKAYLATLEYGGPPARVPNGLVNGIIALRRFGEAAFADDMLARYPPEAVAKIEGAVARARTVEGGCFRS